MTRTVPAPPLAQTPEATSADFIGAGGGPGGPGFDPDDGPEFSPDGSATPPSAHRMMMLLAIIWSVFLFATITLALEWRWAHSPDWISIRLPQALFAGTAPLLISSVTLEFARRSLRFRRSKTCVRWIGMTLLLGVAFVGCQLLAWSALSYAGVHIASNAGSLFLYLLTGAHAVHFVFGLASLAAVGRLISRPSQQAVRENALGVMALYWHFMSGLWLYLLALLLITIQR